MYYLENYFILTLFLSFIIVLFAYLKRKVDFSAVFASGLVGGLVMFGLGDMWAFVYLILGFFAFGNIVTKYRHSVKEEYHVSEGVRTYRNVFGNGGAATLFSIAYFFSGNSLFLIAMLGAMATATADTFATEVGQAHEKSPQMITTRKRVHVGKSGAISVPGLLASIFGAAIISAIAVILSHDLNMLVIGSISGFFGALIDSLIGATIESKAFDTHANNFTSTLLGGIIAVVFVFLI